jgi:hypothetical protein
MKSTVEHIEELTEKVFALTHTKVEIAKLEATDKISSIIGKLIGKIVVVFVFISAFTVVNFGIAYWIGDILNNISYGFFIVGGFYVLIGLLVVFFKKELIINPFKKIVLQNILN